MFSLLQCLYFKIVGKMYTRSFSACLTFQNILFGDDLFAIAETVLDMTELYLIGSAQSCKHNEEV